MDSHNYGYYKPYPPCAILNNQPNTHFFHLSFLTKVNGNDFLINVLPMSSDFNSVKSGKPHVQLGKNGLTPAVLDHFRSRLKTLKIMKIKVLPDAVETFGMDQICSMLLTELKAIIYDIRGFTLVISKRPIPGLKIPKRIQEIRSILKPQLQEIESDDISSDDQPDGKASVIIPETLSEDYASEWSDNDYLDYEDEDLMAEIDDESDLIEISDDDLNARNAPLFKQNIPSGPEATRTHLRSSHPIKPGKYSEKKPGLIRGSRPNGRSTFGGNRGGPKKGGKKSSKSSKSKPQKLLRGPSTRPEATKNKNRQKRGQGSKIKSPARKTGRVAKGRKKS